MQAVGTLHAVPSGAAGLAQPRVGSQVPATWHWSDAGHTTGEPEQTPDWHTSDSVQMFASLHAVPSAAAGVEQAPDVGSHAPAMWHWSLAVQTTGLLPEQAPLKQA